MFYNIEVALNFVKENWATFWLIGVIMVSAITVLIGVLKPFVFDKIRIKPIRKACLAFSNIALCFLGNAILYWWNNGNFDLYFHTSFTTAIVSILWYWLYENTCLRDLIHKIGTVVLNKLKGGQLTKKDQEEIVKEVKTIVEEVKKDHKKAQKVVKTDKELKNL